MNVEHLFYDYGRVDKVINPSHPSYFLSLPLPLPTSSNSSPSIPLATYISDLIHRHEKLTDQQVVLLWTQLAPWLQDDE